MKRQAYGVFLALCIGAGAGRAQAAPEEAPALPLSIEDALQRAVGASENMTVAHAGVKRAQAQETQARSEWLPQLNASLNYDRLIEPKIELSTVPALPVQTGPAVAFSPFHENTWRAGLSLTQNLYAGGRTIARQTMSRASRTIADLNLDASTATTLLETVQGYYDAVLAQRLLTIAEASLKLAETTLQQVKLGGQQGTRPEFDVLRAQVSVENQRPQLLSSRNQRDRALLRLKQMLDLPLDQNIALTTPLEIEAAKDIGRLSRQVAGIPETQDQRSPRSAVQEAEATLKMREAAVALARSQHLPSINAVSTYGWLAYPDSTLPEKSDWTKNWTAGLQLSLPLFTGLRTTGELRSAEADLDEARARAQQIQEQAALDTRSAIDDLSTAQAQWEASAGTVAQAERAYQIAELRYRDGVSTQLELSDARLQLQEAQANRARAVRDLQVARVRLALLPRLPLVSSGSGAGGPLPSAASAGSSPSMNQSAPTPQARAVAPQ